MESVVWSRASYWKADSDTRERSGYEPVFVMCSSLIDVSFDIVVNDNRVLGWCRISGGSRKFLEKEGRGNSLRQEQEG